MAMTVIACTAPINPNRPTWHDAVILKGETAMAWLSLLLFLPWFVLLGALYWLFPRQPRDAARRAFDAIALLLAFVLSIAAMLWGHHIGVVQSDAGPIWRQVLAVLYAYGAFLAVLVGAILLRTPWLAQRATKAASKRAGGSS